MTEETRAGRRVAEIPKAAGRAGRKRTFSFFLLFYNDAYARIVIIYQPANAGGGTDECINNSWSKGVRVKEITYKREGRGVLSAGLISLSIRAGRFRLVTARRTAARRRRMRRWYGCAG